MSQMQLEINLNPVKSNRLRTALEQGGFITLIETQVPDGEMDKDSGIQRLTALEKTVLSSPLENTGLAITDNVDRREWKAVEFASALPEENRDRHLVYLSGSGTGKTAVSELLQIAENANLYNIIPVSGDVPAKSRTAKECRKLNFTESIDMLQMLRSKSEHFFTGAGINPFQYTPYTLLGSYYKLMKKLNCGAGFLVTQIGWDMLKLQSLSWYLTSRDVYLPKIARLALLSPERAEMIVSGGQPGIKISRDMKKQLAKELTYSRNPFESVQYRRLALQIAGCRVMGFSGVQISGVDTPVKAEYILNLVQSALREFDSFESWLAEYNSFMASMEMAPFERNFQLYDRILHRNYPYDAPPSSRELPPAPVTIQEKTRYCLRSFLFPHADRQRAANARLLKILVSGCRGCGTCSLPQKNFICPMNCPMQLRNGICGSVNPDGSCPFTRQECVHHRILRIGHWKNRLPEQENIIVRSDD